MCVGKIDKVSFGDALNSGDYFYTISKRLETKLTHLKCLGPN